MCAVLDCVRAGLVAFLGLFVLSVPPAAASPVHVVHSATCETLQTQLDAPSTAAGDEFRMTSPVCANAAYTIPAGRSVSISGAPTRFTGAASGGPVFSTPGTSATLELVLADMTVVGPSGEAGVRAWVDGGFSVFRSAFVGAGAQPGAGVDVLAEDVYIENSIFRGNHATGGGGLRVETSRGTDVEGRSIQLYRNRFESNSATLDGGGAYLQGNGGAIQLTQNTFAGNSASGSAGGGAVIDAPGASVVLEDNRFVGNELNHRFGLYGPRVGGGLALLGANAKGVVQSRNRFERNSVGAAATNDLRNVTAGGGEYLHARSALSSRDLFVGNRLLSPPSGTSEGGGLAFNTAFLDPWSPCRGSLTAGNMIAAGNSLVGSGRGAGVAVGCAGGSAGLHMYNSTVAANAGGSGGSAAIAGRGADSLTLRNTIAFSGSTPDLGGFSRIDAGYSDACQRTRLAFAGKGNICANPRLANAAGGNVGQTSTSPTWDAGSSALVPSSITQDAFGGRRVQGTAVDIGAHERAGRSDTVRPRLARVRLTRRRFRVPPGSRLRFRVSEAGRARVVMRRRGKKYLRVLSRRVKRGANSIRIGRVSRRKLRVGPYRLTLTVTDRAGNRSRASRLRFQVRR